MVEPSRVRHRYPDGGSPARMRALFPPRVERTAHTRSWKPPSACPRRVASPTPFAGGRGHHPRELARRPLPDAAILVIAAEVPASEPSIDLDRGRAFPGCIAELMTQEELGEREDGVSPPW